MVLYFLHSVALLLLPKANPRLFASVTARVPLSLQRAAAILSMAAMGGLIALQVAQDVSTLDRLSLAQRLCHHATLILKL